MVEKKNASTFWTIFKSSNWEDHLQVFKLGVSLGSTESLAEHPHSMTHAKVDDELKPKIGISENLIRLSIGVEDYEDLIQDLNAALNRII